MKELNAGALLTLFFTIINITAMNAQNNNQLSPKEQGIVSIAALTANGDLEQLKPALGKGLDAGLTINEVKEELVQLYAYCGFPRSLNGIITFMAVLDERKAKGIHDPEGEMPKPVTGTNESKYQAGKNTLQALTGKSQDGPLTGANAFAPGIDAFLKEHLFADIFGRGVLTFQQRELATIAVLATLPGLQSQLKVHISMGMQVGLSESRLRDAFKLLGSEVSRSQADAANNTLTQLLNSNN